MKFKVQVKVNFTVAERCHYHHAKIGAPTSNRADHMLSCNMADGGNSHSSSIKKRAAKGNDQHKYL